MIPGIELLLNKAAPRERHAAELSIRVFRSYKEILSSKVSLSLVRYRRQCVETNQIHNTHENACVNVQPRDRKIYEENNRFTIDFTMRTNVEESKLDCSVEEV